MRLHTVFPVVLNMSITASAAIAVILVARAMLKRAPKIFSYALWAVVLFRLLCPVSLPSWFSLMGLFPASTAEAGRMEYVSLDELHRERPAAAADIPPSDVNQTQNHPVKPPPAEDTAANTADVLVSVGSVVWICGVAAMLALHIFQLIRLRGRLTACVPLDDTVYLADDITAPFVIGVIRPKIYLPSAMPDAGQTYVIRHERHHIRRGDHVFRLLAFAALCIHWFNPLVWLAFVLSGRDMEMSCDEAVMKQMGRDIRADYSLSLLQCSTGKRVFTGTPLAFGEGDTRERIENIMKYKKPTIPMVVLAAAICVGLAACLCSNPQSERVRIDLPAMEEGTLRDTLRPYLDAYNLCVSDSYGVELSDDSYWRCYSTEADSQRSDENDPAAIAMLIPSGSAIPEGLYVDAAYADCVPVNHYACVQDLKGYFGEWIAEDAEFLTTGLAASFFDYEGRVYRVTGAHGSGSARIDPDSATLVAHTGNHYLVQVDWYLFDQKQNNPVTLSFAVQDGKLVITGEGDPPAGAAPPADQVAGAQPVGIQPVEEEAIGEGLYWQHIEDGDGIYLAISPQTTIHAFRFVPVMWMETETGLHCSVGEARYAVNTLTAEQPFLVKLQFAGLLPTYGIVFQDETNRKRFFTINMSGLDPKESDPYYLQEIDISIPAFSYAEDCATYAEGEPGVKTSGFLNTTGGQADFDTVVGLAKGECTINWDSWMTYFDPAASVWRVDFFRAGMAGGGQSIYLDATGKTVLLVSGE